MTTQYLNLPELLFLRQKDGFRLLDTSGGEYNINKPAAIVLLCASGKSSVQKIFTDAKQYIDLKKEQELEQIVGKFIKIGLLNQKEYIYEPFRTKVVLDNLLNRPDLNALNLSSITISPSRLCAYQCAGCYSLSGPSAKSESKLEAQIASLEGASKLGATICAIGGGEPTHPKVIEKSLTIAKYARKFGYDNVTMLSSGYDVKKHIRELKPLITQIELSLDGMEKYHNKYRCHPQAFSRAIDAAKACKKNSVNFDINSVIVKENLDQIEDIVNLSIELGANSINLMPILCVGRAQANNIKLTPDEVKEIRMKVKSAVDKYSNKISMKFSDESVKGPMACRAGISTAYVTENGMVCGCNNLTDEPAGNLEKESFEEIWSFSKKFEELRDIKNINSRCGSCNDRDYCIGKCKAIAKSVFGTYDLSVDRGCPAK